MCVFSVFCQYILLSYENSRKKAGKMDKNPNHERCAGVRADSSTGDWCCLGVRGVDIHTQWYSYWILNNALIWRDTILNTSTIQQQHSYSHVYSSTRLHFYIPIYSHKVPQNNSCQRLLTKHTISYLHATLSSWTFTYSVDLLLLIHFYIVQKKCSAVDMLVCTAASPAADALPKMFRDKTFNSFHSFDIKTVTKLTQLWETFTFLHPSSALFLPNISITASILYCFY